MPEKRSRASHHLSKQHGKFTLGEWIGSTLAFLAIVIVFCLFFIRRHSVEYKLEHSFGIRSPEFFGSALALTAPVPMPGNKIELLENGDAYFPAMLEAIRGAKQSVNF